jgi:HlyD family secretion protein
MVAGALLVAAACGGDDEQGLPQASGFVEATDVRIAAEVGGRVREVRVAEGARVAEGEIVVVLSTTDVDLVLRRVRAERGQAVAQLRLLEAGARPEEIRQVEAQVATARAERQAAASQLAAAETEVRRYEQLVRTRAGAEKQRDDAVARRDLAAARLQAAADRVAVAEAAVATIRAGARPQEIAAARARIAAIDAQIAALEQARSDATVIAPSDGVVTSRLVEPGELVSPGTPLLIVVDLDDAWANVYVEEPLVPQLRIDQPATVVTDAGDRLEGRISFISPRAEFTPRNVQTADERARLVYRVKVAVDNRGGILKPGMPVVAQWSAPR